MKVKIETAHGDSFKVEADLAQAAAPILVDGETSPYQVASARHDRDAALWLALEYIYAEDGASLTAVKKLGFDFLDEAAVSYTHLTLPTIYSV